MPPDVGKQAVDQGGHPNMVQQHFMGKTAAFAIRNRERGFGLRPSGIRRW